MKVLVIMGSPRKGKTYRAAKKIEESMQSMGNVEFEYLMLKDAGLSQCSGCLVCFGKGEDHCPHKDNAHIIEQKMHAADGVIFATPVYGMSVSALMKTFIDRFHISFIVLVFLVKRLFFSLQQVCWEIKKFSITSN